MHQLFPFSLKDGKKTRPQVAGHEQAKEGDRPIVMTVEGIVNGESEIAAGQDFETGNPMRAVTISLGHNAIRAGLDAILRGSDEFRLCSEQGRHYRPGIGDGEPDARGYQ